MNNHICSFCNKGCYYDGRCGDGPILMCGCKPKNEWVKDPTTGKIDLVRVDPIAVKESERDYPWK